VRARRRSRPAPFLDEPTDRTRSAARDASSGNIIDRFRSEAGRRPDDSLHGRAERLWRSRGHRRSRTSDAPRYDRVELIAIARRGPASSSSVSTDRARSTKRAARPLRG
jgi:hypothetical protein